MGVFVFEDFAGTALYRALVFYQVVAAFLLFAHHFCQWFCVAAFGIIAEFLPRIDTKRVAATFFPGRRFRPPPQPPRPTLLFPKLNPIRINTSMVNKAKSGPLWTLGSNFLQHFYRVLDKKLTFFMKIVVDEF